jgi:hypothetical protein
MRARNAALSGAERGDSLLRSELRAWPANECGLGAGNGYVHAPFRNDACYSQQNLDLMCIQAGNHDPAAARGSLQRLKDLAEKHDAEIFFSHDAASWPKYSPAPGFYS